MLTQMYIKHTNKIIKQFFRRISPFGVAPVDKTQEARTRWYRGPFRPFTNTRFFLKYL